METIDPADPQAELRWQVALQRESPESDQILASCDRACVALGVAERTCESARQKMREHRPFRQIREQLVETRTALERTSDHITEASSALASDSQELRERLTRVETQLSEGIANSINHLESLLSDSDKHALGEIESSLETLLESITGAKRVAR